LSFIHGLIRRMNVIKSFILFIVLAFFLPGIAQNRVVDSLINEINNRTKNDTVRVDLMYKVAFSSFQSNIEITKSYLRKVVYLSDSLNYTKGSAKAFYLKGILESRKSNYKESIEFFKSSLKNYESIKDKDGIGAVYNAFGITHFIQSQYEEALNYYKKASDIFEKSGNKKELINSLIRVANVYNETGKYDEAIYNYYKALEQYKLINDKTGMSFVYGNLGVLYKTQGNYPLAIDYYNQSLDYARIIGDTLGMAIKLNNLGDAYLSVGKNDRALEYHKQSLKYALQVENKDQVAVNNSNIGNIYLQKKEYKKALTFYQSSLKISKEINNLTQVAICYYNTGALNLLLNKPLIARENFIKSKDVSSEIGYKYMLSSSFLGIAETYVYKKQYQKALSFVDNGKAIAEELDLLEEQKKASNLLFIIYKNTGEYKKALNSHELYKTLNDSIFNEENIEKITRLEYEYKYKQQLDSLSINELKLTKIVRDTSQSLEKTQRNLFLGVIGFLATAIILGGVIFFLKLRHEKAKTQNAVIEQRLLRSQMTPHFIFNSLSVLQGMILNKEDKKSVFYLSKFSKLLRITLENSRDKLVPLSHELEAVNNYLELQNLEASQSYDYTILVDKNIDEDIFRIPPMLIQPFIENAIEHAFENRKENRKIDIELKYVSGDLICTITDNGIGIDAQNSHKRKDKKSLATTITSERLKMLSKDFNIDGSVCVEDRKKYNEQGTIVTLVIPYKKI
jgi:tetratricopeptide (TPR) repeat protein